MQRRRPTIDEAVRVGPISLPNAIIAASGTFGHGAEFARLCPPGELGAVTMKSLAAFPWEGNAPLRTTEAPGGGMLNSVGLMGPGVAAWIDDDLPDLRATGARVIVSVWGRTVGDYAAATTMLAPASGDLLAVEVNLSCPNLDGGKHMFAADVEATTAVIGAVVAATDLPVFAKLTAAVTDVVAVARAAIDAGAVGLTLINTMLGLAIDADSRRTRLGAGGGGLSGPPIKPIALRAVAEVARALPDVPIIGTGGVTSGLDAAEMLIAGASAVGVGTATFAEPRATLRIRRELAQWCAARATTPAALRSTLEMP